MNPWFGGIAGVIADEEGVEPQIFGQETGPEHACWNGLREGALWIYGQGVAELELEAPSPMLVGLYADARAVEPELVEGRTTIRIELPSSGWHPFIVQGAPGLRLLRAGFE